MAFDERQMLRGTALGAPRSGGPLGRFPSPFTAVVETATGTARRAPGYVVLVGQKSYH